jgi:phage/plasmid-associated DNA primase
MEEITPIVKENINYEAILRNVDLLLKRQAYLLDDEEVIYRYDKQDKYWKRASDLDMVNDLNDMLGCAHALPPSVRESYKTAIKLRGKKRWVSRVNCDSNNAKYFVQFGDEIYNVRSGLDFSLPASEQHFKFFAITRKPSASSDTPNIDELFNSWTNGKAELLKDICAYCCFPDNPLKLIFFHYGQSNSGKSMFLQVLEKFLGEENCTTSTFGMLADVSQRFELGKLKNKLIVTCSEIDGKTLYHTSILKQISGMDSLRGEYKGNNNHFSFKFFGKAHIATNNIPEIKDNSDEAFKGRCAIIEYPNKYKTSAIPIIEKIPANEYNNLTKYCLTRLQEWFTKGEIEIKDLPTFDERIKFYRRISNPLVVWFENNIEFDNNEYDDLEQSEYSIHSSDLIDSLNAWLQQHGYKAKEAREVGLWIKAHYDGKYKRVRKGDEQNRFYIYYGIKKRITVATVPTVPSVPIDSSIERPIGKVGTVGTVRTVIDYFHNYRCKKCGSSPCVTLHPLPLCYTCYIG